LNILDIQDHKLRIEKTLELYVKVGVKEEEDKKIIKYFSKATQSINLLKVNSNKEQEMLDYIALTLESVIG